MFAKFVLCDIQSAASMIFQEGTGCSMLSFFNHEAIISIIIFLTPAVEPPLHRGEGSAQNDIHYNDNNYKINKKHFQ